MCEREEGWRVREGGRGESLIPTVVKPDLGKHPKCFHGVVVYQPVGVGEEGLEGDSQGLKNMCLEGGKILR